MPGILKLEVLRILFTNLNANDTEKSPTFIEISKSLNLPIQVLVRTVIQLEDEGLITVTESYWRTMDDISDFPMTLTPMGVQHCIETVGGLTFHRGILKIVIGYISGVFTRN